MWERGQGEEAHPPLGFRHISLHVNSAPAPPRPISSFEAGGSRTAEYSSHEIQLCEGLSKCG